MLQASEAEHGNDSQCLVILYAGDKLFNFQFYYSSFTFKQIKLDLFFTVLFLDFSHEVIWLIGFEVLDYVN